MPRKFGTKTKIGGGPGPVEVDETFIGGLAQEHARRAPGALHLGRPRGSTGGASGKTIVHGNAGPRSFVRFAPRLCRT